MNSQKIRFSCPSCGIQLDVPATLAGISGPCPSCASVITAPELPPSPEPQQSAAPPVQPPAQPQEPPISPPPQPAPTPEAQSPEPIEAGAPLTSPATSSTPEPAAPPQQIPSQQAQVELPTPSAPTAAGQQVFPTTPEPIVHPEAAHPEPAAAEPIPRAPRGVPVVRSIPSEPSFPLEEPARASATISHSTEGSSSSSRGGVIRKIDDLPPARSSSSEDSYPRSRSRIPGLLFLLAVLFIAGACVIGVLFVNGMFGIKLPFLPDSATGSEEKIQVGSPIEESSSTDENAHTSSSPGESPTEDPSEVNPLLIDPESPSGTELQAVPEIVIPPTGTLPAGEEFRKGETPLPAEIDLSTNDDPESIKESLFTFLEAENLIGREEVISATAMQDPRVSESLLAGPLPKSNSVTYLTTFRDEVEERTDFFYLVGWDGERDSPTKPITVQLHRWSEREPPRIHVEAFLEAYEQRLIRYAATPREEPGRFHVLGRCTPKCFEFIPGAMEKATLRIASYPKDSTPIKAYFSKNGELLDEFKQSLDGLAMKEEIPLTITLQWSSEEESPRYLELVRVDSFDWHP